MVRAHRKVPPLIVLTAAFILVALTVFTRPATAGQNTPPELSLKFQTGEIAIADGVARIQVPEHFGFLDAAQTRRVIVEMWGNPDNDSDVLGMIAPTDIPLQDRASWGVLLYYSKDGHVADDDAKSINYDDLLKQMQDEVRSFNSERQQAGYPPINLVGWAEAPHYDQASHKLYWAKQLKFGNEPEDTLNYSIRALGREGVLELNIVASMAQLKVINTHIPGILAMVDFSQGQRYADYKPGVDKLAVYGIGALIAGKVAVKAGFLKLIIAGLLAMKKLVILLIVGAAGLLKKLLGRKGEAAPAGTVAASEAPASAATWQPPQS